MKYLKLYIVLMVGILIGLSLGDRLALLLMLLFEYQADQGLHLFQFQQWRIDISLLEMLSQYYHALLEAEEMASTQALTETLERSARVGFAVYDDGCFWLTPAVYRYLDLFEELAKADKPELDEVMTSSPIDIIGVS